MEKQFLLPFALKRLKKWSGQKIEDRASRHRFEKGYLQPLQKVVINLQVAGSEKYAEMEKLILAGCVRENMDALSDNQFPGVKAGKNVFINELLSKLDSKKTTKIL